MSNPLLPYTLPGINPDQNFYRITNNTYVGELCLVAISYDAGAADMIKDAQIINLTNGIDADGDTLESNYPFGTLHNTNLVSRVVYADTIRFSPNTPGVILASLVAGGVIEFPLNGILFVTNNGVFNQVEFGVLDLEHIS